MSGPRAVLSLPLSPQWPIVSHSVQGLQKPFIQAIKLAVWLYSCSPAGYQGRYCFVGWCSSLSVFYFYSVECVFVLSLTSSSSCQSDGGLPGDSDRRGDLSAYCWLCVPRLGPQGHQQRFSGQVSVAALSHCLCCTNTHKHAPSYTLFTVCFPTCSSLQQSSPDQQESSGKLYKVYISVCLMKRL